MCYMCNVIYVQCRQCSSIGISGLYYEYLREMTEVGVRQIKGRAVEKWSDRREIDT